MYLREEGHTMGRFVSDMRRQKYVRCHAARRLPTLGAGIGVCREQQAPVSWKQSRRSCEVILGSGACKQSRRSSEVILGSGGWRQRLHNTGNVLFLLPKLGHVYEVLEELGDEGEVARDRRRRVVGHHVEELGVHHCRADEAKEQKRAHRLVVVRSSHRARGIGEPNNAS